MILSDPLYMAIAAVLLIVIVFTLVKKLVKWAAILILIFAVYLFLVIRSGDDPQKTMKRHLKQTEKQVEKIIDEAEEIGEKAGKSIPKDVKKKAKKVVKDLKEK